jgi:imidazolonepropionase
MKVDLIVTNIGELVYFKDSNLETLQNAAIAINEGKIVEFGKRKEIEDKYYTEEKHQVIDAEWNSVIPGFVDPHTHLVYSGCRHEEFLAKLKGKEYLDLLKEGKGINYTVSLTRKDSAENLFKASYERLIEMRNHGSLTVEIKSGYGLNFETEKKLLDVAEMLKEKDEADIVTTFLGAHAIPQEYKDNRRGYINLLKDKMIPAFSGKAKFIDIFIDRGAFTVDEAREILSVAVKYGYEIKMHIDELSYTGAAKLAMEFPVVSTEHMEHTTEEDLEILKERNVVPVLLPGTCLFLRLKERPKIEFMREIKLPIALGTDHNPGTSPFYSQSLIMALGVFLYGLSVEEALLGITLNAAKAIKMEKLKGNIGPGFDADLLILKSHSFVHLVYEVGRNLIGKIIRKGKPINIH